MYESEKIDKKRLSIIPSLITKIIFMLLIFFMVNLYANYKYDLENFLSDFPKFFLIASNLLWTVNWIYPIAIVALGLLIERFSRGRGVDEGSLGERFAVILGQSLFSIFFFYILWYIMFNIPGYPSPVDQSLVMGAFFSFCVFTFITIVILSSDDVKNLINYIILNFIKVYKK